MRRQPYIGANAALKAVVYSHAAAVCGSVTHYVLHQIDRSEIHRRVGTVGIYGVECLPDICQVVVSSHVLGHFGQNGRIVIVCHVGIIAVAYGAVCFIASGGVGQWRYCFQFCNLTVYIRVGGIEVPRTSK